MSADDNLRDALIEAFRREASPEEHLNVDFGRVADIALKVIKDWTAEEPRRSAGHLATGAYHEMQD